MFLYKTVWIKLKIYIKELLVGLLINAPNNITEFSLVCHISDFVCFTPK